MVTFSEYNIHTISLQDFDVQDDIHLFLRHRFHEISTKRRAVIRNSASPWPLDADIDTLVHRASGLFILATTVMQFIGDKRGNPLQRLERIVEVKPQASPSPYADLDQLYTQILGMVPDTDILQKILGVIVVLFDPLLLGELVNLLSSESGDILLAVEALHSVLHIPAEENRPVTMYHESLKDFLLGSRRSKE